MNPEIEELRSQIAAANRRIRVIQDNCPHENVRVEQTEDYYSQGLRAPGYYTYGIDVFCHDCCKDMWFDEQDEEYQHFIDKARKEDERGD